MDIFELMNKRRSVRLYSPNIVEQSKLDQILEVARLSPSACNFQPWRFVIVTNSRLKHKLKASYNQDWFLNAPVIIVGCAVPSEAWKRADGEKYWKVDVAIAMQSMILAATELGLGTCWVASFNEKAAKKALELPKDWRIVAMTPIGYPLEKKGQVRNRKSREDIVVFR